MKLRLIVCALGALLASCASFQVGGKFLSGRQALLRNEPETALAYFSEVAKQNPDYVYESMYFREGIWTYVGRAQYQLGKLDEARRSLERALAQDPNDNMARLYFGLTLLRSGESEPGFKELQSGLRGLYDWIEYMESSRPLQAYWDPTREIRNAIDKEVQAIRARDIDREELVANAEWVGKQMEEEIDRARGDERRRWERGGDLHRGTGVGVGIGIGF